MKKLAAFGKKFLADESGQGMAEYILLLVVVIGIVVAFKGQIKAAFDKQVGDVSSSITNFNGN